MNIFGQFQFLGEGLLGTRNPRAFQARYCVMKEMENGGRKFSVEVGQKNLEELAERVGQHSYRVRKEDCLDLPPKIYTTRDVDLTSEQKRVYSEIRDQAFTLLNDMGDHVSTQAVITQVLRLQQVVCGHVRDDEGTDHDIPTNRVSALADVVSETAGDVIVWARYRRDIEKIVAELSRNYGPESVAQYHGGNTDSRQEDVKRFLGSQDCRFMVSNQQTGGYGNTWLNGRTVVYYSNSHSLEHRLQSEDRPHRSGQTEPVTYVDLVTRGTVDEKILKSLRGGIDMASLSLGEQAREWVV